MSRQQIEKMVRRHATGLLKEKGYISPVDLLVGSPYAKTGEGLAYEKDSLS